MQQRWKITLEYDGSAFSGWQKQDNTPRSVQQTIEQALYAFCQQHTTAIAAGRTDKGVHALAQVIHIDLTPMPRITAQALRDGLNYHLKDHNIAILAACQARKDFHARFHATQRHYLYKIINRYAPAPLLRQRAWHIRQPLDSTRMHNAAQKMVGLHDFSHFRSAACQAKNPIRHINAITLTKTDPLITLHVQAPAFLYKQVRIMTATLVAIGRNQLPVSQLETMLANRNTTTAAPAIATAPAYGLYLAKIDYAPVT